MYLVFFFTYISLLIPLCHISDNLSSLFSNYNYKDFTDYVYLLISSVATSRKKIPQYDLNANVKHHKSTSGFELENPFFI